MNTNAPSLTIDGIIIPVTPHPEHEYTLTTAEVAAGYGVSLSSVKEHKRKHADELCAGEHFLEVRNPDFQPGKGGSHTSILWTKRGIIHLGFFITSERAKRFRKMAADLVLREWQGETDATLAGTVASLLPVLHQITETTRALIEMTHQIIEFQRNHEGRIAALEAQMRARSSRDRFADDASDPEKFEQVLSLFKHPKRAGRGRTRHTLSLEERRMIAAHRIAEALLENRGTSFRVSFQQILRIGRELGLDEFKFEDFSSRFPEKGTPAMHSSLGKLVNRLFNGQTFVIDGVEWSFVKADNSRGSTYRAIREN